MMKLLLLLCIVLVSGCSTYSLKSGPGLKDLSDIPAPRTGGAVVNFSTRYRRGDFEIILSTLLNSGYFNRVTFNKGQSNSERLFIDIDHYLYKQFGGGLVAATSALSGLTLGVVPLMKGWEETWKVTVKGADGKELKKYKYEYEGIVSTTIWPWVFLLGATESRSERQRYARFASNLIHDLNKDGYLSE